MSDVRLSPEQILPSGLAATYTGSLDTGNTYLVRNDGRIALHFKKSGAGACNVTIATPGTVGGNAIAERVVEVPATTGDRFIGPLPPHIYNDGSGDLSITVSEVTGLTVAVLRL